MKTVQSSYLHLFNILLSRVEFLSRIIESSFSTRLDTFSKKFQFNSTLFKLSTRLELKYSTRHDQFKEDDFEKSFEVRIVRTMKIFIICWVDSHTDVWWINIEAENHVCYDINLFNEQSYWKIIDNSIVTANNETVFILKKSSIMIDILLNNQSIKIQLIDVYHCSELHYNLMSINQMKVKEYMCSIKNNEFRFMNFRDVITLIDLKNDKKEYFVNTSINSSNS